MQVYRYLKRRVQWSLIDIGGGTTEVAVISLNGCGLFLFCTYWGDRFDEAIINYVRRNYGSLIGGINR